MLSLIKKTLIPILILASVTTTDAFSLRKRVTAAASTEIITAPLPEPLPFNAVLTDSIININTSKLIVPISDYLRAIDFSDMPEEYDIWSDTKINPYQVNLVNMKDTVKIDMSTFCTPVQSYVTSNFGFRRWRHHYGIDLKVHRGDSVNNAFDGVVRITKRARDYGYYVLVRHFNGLETLYAHLNKITVNPGDTLKAGVPVGLGGNTGRSTGYHLHFEVRYLGNPINPNDIIDFQSFTLKNQILVLNAQHFEYKKEIDKIRFWIVRRGDTLGRISQRTGISIAKLCSINGIRRNSILRIGQRIRYT
ncbi:MAG: peptidase M23 [Bacteroidetes bacterium HGW-Bacteroidetes-7]|jgi:murein DD-endopeptidase MepM/ murein hydrolase activator NlpD|nr:MAG: peptidase M23 [Bacteroidetes bacterium HGW-Bacteroidetes-7]